MGEPDVFLIQTPVIKVIYVNWNISYCCIKERLKYRK